MQETAGIFSRRLSARSFHMQLTTNYVTCRTSSLPTRPFGRGNVKKNYQTISGSMPFGSALNIVRVSDMIARVKAATDGTKMFYSRKMKGRL